MTFAATPPDPGFVDVLASGVHDTKNTLFDALSRIDAVRRTLRATGDAPPDSDAAGLLTEAYVAVERSADRLAQILAAYRFIRHENPVALLPTPLADLCEYVRLRATAEWRSAATLAIHPAPNDVWILDRELIADCLVNALLNAGRHAKTQVTMDFKTEGDWLAIEVGDDGPGYPEQVLQGNTPAGSIGLFLAARLAALHHRNERCGALQLSNPASGGARFRLLLP